MRGLKRILKLEFGDPYWQTNVYKCKTCARQVGRYKAALFGQPITNGHFYNGEGLR